MQTKSDLRKEARARRAGLAHPDFAARLAAHADALGIADASLVGAYVALPGEADPHLLLKALSLRGCTLAFPRVVARNAPLAFHHWRPGREFVAGAYGIAEPAADWPVAYPRILLLPLLAFDAAGCRLGYGGGYYDRTIAELRKGGEVRIIGVAFAGQEVAGLPHEAHDIVLDAVVTEQGLTPLPREGRG